MEEVLLALRRLPLEDQRRVLAAGAKDLSLVAWCDSDYTPAHSAPRPRRGTWHLVASKASDLWFSHVF